MATNTEVQKMFQQPFWNNVILGKFCWKFYVFYEEFPVLKNIQGYNWNIEKIEKIFIR